MGSVAQILNPGSGEKVLSYVSGMTHNVLNQVLQFESYPPFTNQGRLVAESEAT